MTEDFLLGLLSFVGAFDWLGELAAVAEIHDTRRRVALQHKDLFGVRQMVKPYWYPYSQYNRRSSS